MQSLKSMPLTVPYDYILRGPDKGLATSQDVSRELIEANVRNYPPQEQILTMEPEDLAPA